MVSFPGLASKDSRALKLVCVSGIFSFLSSWVFKIDLSIEMPELVNGSKKALTLRDIKGQILASKVQSEGETWCLLSTKWLDELEIKEKRENETTVHPIDNSCLFSDEPSVSPVINGLNRRSPYSNSTEIVFGNNFTEPSMTSPSDGTEEQVYFQSGFEWMAEMSLKLRDDLTENIDYFFLPIHLMEQLISIFGIEEPKQLNLIQLKSVQVGIKNEFLIELYPLKLKFELADSMIDNSFYFVLSKYLTVADCIRIVEEKTNVVIRSLYLSNKQTKLKEAKLLVDYGLTSGSTVYYDDLENNLLDANDSDSLERFDTEKEDFFQNGPDKWQKSPPYSFGKYPYNKLNSNGFSSKDLNYSGMFRSSTKKYDADEHSDDFESTQILPQITNFCQSSDESVPLFRANDGRLLASKNAGLRGLYNLGNTCFMNSAIQSLSHCVDLTEYFLNQKFQSELNTTNPLGMKGQLAKAYARVLFQLWNGDKSAVSPHELKYIMAKFNGMFSGYQQHDSQEFLGFLLDGLHEDLNRIINKPFVENKEYTGKDEKKFAQESWNAYKQRNDSVIVDKFHGQCKSTLVCPECKHVSVTFDPMAYLALPIPINHNRQVEIVFVGRNSIKPHQFFSSFDKNALIEDVKAELYENHPQFSDTGKSFAVFEISTTDLIPLKELHDYHPVEYLKQNSILGIYELKDEKEECLLIYFIRHKRILSYPIMLSLKKYTSLSKENLFDKLATKIGVDLRSSTEEILLQKWRNPSYHRPEYEEVTESTAIESGSSIFLSLDADFPAELEDVLVEQLPFLKDRKESSSKDGHGKFSLYDCLDLFVSPEKLGQHDPWYCPKCKTHRQATKKFDLWNCSDYLVIFLKRFSSSHRWGSKINCTVSFPLKDFNLSDYLPEGSDASSKYNLVAIINHMGSISGGHYTSYARNEADSRWYCFDDSFVSPINNEQDLISSSAYVLFYKRIKA